MTELSITDQFGRTPLHNAILGKQLRIVEIIVSSGADIQVQDERGDTPLHTAVRTGDESILQVGYQIQTSSNNVELRWPNEPNTVPYDFFIIINVGLNMLALNQTLVQRVS